MNYEEKYNDLVERKAMADLVAKKLGDIRFTVSNLHQDAEFLIKQDCGAVFVDQIDKLITELTKVKETIVSQEL
jgi:hypothetical protein